MKNIMTKEIYLPINKQQYNVDDNILAGRCKNEYNENFVKRTKNMKDSFKNLF